MGMDDSNLLVQCDFEVFGHVQGVGFTKICRDNCANADIRGWVKNSKRGTIIGKMQGVKTEVDKMVEWLRHIGSPGCKIEKTEFENWNTITRYDYKDYQIRF
ncbi:unnamed protein product [Diamesa hyperborea]